MYSREMVDALGDYVFIFGFIVICITTLCFQPFWIRQLIHCFKHQKESRISWILFILFTNVFGAFWYWRLTPDLPKDIDEFDKKVDDWLNQRGLSLKKSKNRLVKGGDTASIIVLLLWIPFILLVLLSRFVINLSDIKVPNLNKYVTIFIITTLVFAAIKKMIELYKDDRFVSPWLVIPILQAKRGIRKEKMFFFGEKREAKDPVMELATADLFTFIAIIFNLINLLNIITFFQELSILASACFLTFGLLSFFVAIRSNATIIFYNHPKFVFFVLKHYKVLSIISYFIPVLMMFGALMMITQAIVGI